MKTTVNEYDFVRAFNNTDRENNFSNAGRRALFEFLEQLEEETGTETELDIISLCCEFTEYEDLEEFQSNYGEDIYPDMETIIDVTTVIPVNEDSFIIQNFSGWYRVVSPLAKGETS